MDSGNNKSTLFLIILHILIFMSVACHKQDAAKPNIVLIYADDLDFDEISPYDHKLFPCYTGARENGFYRYQSDSIFVQNNRPLVNGEQGFFEDPRMYTPNIQRLADEGAVFDRFYITTSVCTPSRYSLLTGRLATRSPGFLKNNPAGAEGNITWNSPLVPEENNIAKELKKLGYYTGVVGKWHNGARDALDNSVEENSDPRDPEVLRKIKAAHERACSYLRDQIGFDFADRMFFRNKERLAVPKNMRVHNLEWVTEGALNFIDEAGNRPFFLYMPLTIPHGQYYYDWLQDDPLATPAGWLDEVPDCMPSRTEIVAKLGELGIDKRNALATHMDESVGAVIRKLEDNGRLDNTLFIFASDHQSRGKFTCYEASRVPFIARWPDNIRQGSRVEDLCANVDIAATLIEVAGGNVPQNMLQDGRSFLPSLLGRAKPEDKRQSVYLECNNIRAVVTRDFKYIANRPSEEIMKRMAAEIQNTKKTGKLRQIGWSGAKNWHVDEEGVVYSADRDFPFYFDADQLYDLQADPFEQNNLIDKPEMAETLQDLKTELTDYLNTLPHVFGEYKTE
jgi:arylsulfatase A-like enzyme